MYGKIHSLVSYSNVDGPGIRYVVFMQGCNLRCKYCHNPDTWNINTENKVKVDELVEKIVRCKDYLTSSNGGVTFSGGEPLLQVEFLTEVSKRLREKNIHIAIDTSGNVDVTEKVKELLEYVDLVLLDIKEMSRYKHFNLTGSYNDRIFKFLEYLGKINKSIWIRHVYIPGLTNPLDLCNEDIKKIKSIQKVEILPYHELGKYKWIELGLKYELDDISIPKDEECKVLSEKIFKYIKE
ncbi:MAG: pyruvate formate-lyase activating enzyme [Clostridia bacterium]|jgi:pyruvate formate lyase activating enzyme|nr:pyruvate formate-lyase activating enzyme [Clostridia bacterium]